MSEEMTPIKLLRVLYGFPEGTISDYDVVALVFQEVVGLREQVKNLQPIIINPSFTPGVWPYNGFEVK